MRDSQGGFSEGRPELLDPERIRQHLARPPDALRGLECVGETRSTNADLLARPADAVHRVARLAERQTAGRGRRGRPWFSPHARNIYLSLGWRLDAGPDALGFLPLVVAVAAARALDRLGFTGHGIKWPNDLVTAKGKLGGCLVELRRIHTDGTLAVLGVGLNVRLTGAPGLEALDQPWDELAGELPRISRNETAGRLLGALLEAVEGFERAGLGAKGFDAFLADWNRFDRLAGRDVTIRSERSTAHGRCLGLGPEGGLRIRTDGREREFHAGEVSVRRQAF
ncbi:MAG: biotin--[acetyl-CoA-carboxylase] ligase [Xanthomonadales bacterium]|nr:biotin--[acetyl-CoA-carboxylase] ligase [Xanthomonadales bacterium]